MSWRSTGARAPLPCLVRTLATLEAAAAAGARRVDFLGGAERHKLQLADRMAPALPGVSGWRLRRGGGAAVAARAAAVDARQRLEQPPAQRWYYGGMAPVTRLATSPTSPHRGTVAPARSHARIP
jgi:hypothetical protein